MITLRFESRLAASRERVWEWITSFHGISTEMRPVLRMTSPRHIRSIEDLEIEPGKTLFRSYLLLFGIVPIDYSKLTLLELEPGRGFVEESPMGSMKRWRHERRIHDHPDDPTCVLLVDELTFQPRFAAPLVGWFVRRFFTHRHAMLRKHLATRA